ncbi:uncharacterized protein [Salminus brasiliensis]|uniref:uncharacterized protein isoform X2 n=1 Tax=Salminus brasiliensis TaxID=930266 RepID=UPI003B83378D
MSVRLFLCLFFCSGGSTVSNGQLTQIAQGSDVSLNCLSSSGQARWEVPPLSTPMRVNLGQTEYLLIKDFQQQSEGQYVCNNKTTKLELKCASTNDETVLFRASQGDSLFLFCKGLSSSSLMATWSWRPHHSDHSTHLGQNSALFGNRLSLSLSNKDNDFSLTISPTAWNDSGRYECQLKPKTRTVFELVVVRVHTDRQQLTEGDNVTLQCEVSHELQSVRLYWINTETQQNFSNPLQLRNVMMGQRNWACAAFHSSKLKALIPLTLNISQTLSATARSPTPTPQYLPTDESKRTNSPEDLRTTPSSQEVRQQDFILLCVCTGFFFILTVLIGAACWRKRIKERMESSTRVREVTYAEVKFKQRSETPDVTSPECGLPLNSNNAPAEEKDVIYASVKSM